MGIFLVFGSATALASSKTAELRRVLEKAGIQVETASSPTGLKAKHEQYSHALLMTDASMPPMADMWSSFAKSAKSCRFSAYTKNAIPPQFLKHFTFEQSWKHDAKGVEALISAWADAEMQAESPQKDPEVATSMSDEAPTGILPLGEPSIGVGEEEGTRVQLKVEEAPLLDHASQSEELTSFHVDKSEDDGGLGISLDSEPQSQSVDVDVDGGLGDLFGEAAAVVEFSASPEVSPDLDMSASLDVSAGLEVAGDPASPETPEAFDVEMNSGLGNSENFSSMPGAMEDLPVSPDDVVDSNNTQIVKRYALLKEKENREKQKTIEILRSELSKAKAAHNALQSEKRRLMLKSDDIESERRALTETVEELRHKISNADASVSQKVKDYQTRLENAQFTNKRLEKKLEDFKLRVRLDIQKIRARERELENRLELQKRDAEALIAAKDTRLLNQKREIDKLQFEMEILKERLVEETEKAEDRSEKLQRAVQSLKMAQGMLSGIDEEVIATEERQTGSDNGGEAA